MNDWAYELGTNVFSVSINGGEPLTSDLAFSEGIWFLSAEDPNAAGAEGISSVRLSGSGEVDNIGLGVVQPEVQVTYTDPEGREIEDPALVDWFLMNDFTQADINALGKDTTATDKLSNGIATLAHIEPAENQIVVYQPNETVRALTRVDGPKTDFKMAGAGGTRGRKSMV